MERLAARDDGGDSRALAEEVGHDPGRRGHLLEVVEDEEDLPLVEAIDELLEDRPIDGLAEATHAGEGDEDGLRVARFRQVDEPHAIAETRSGDGRGVDRQRGLARPAGSRERQDAERRVGETLLDRSELGLAADERRSFFRQIARSASGRDDRRKHRRQIRVDQLEDALRSPQVLEPMLAQVLE